MKKHLALALIALILGACSHGLPGLEATYASLPAPGQSLQAPGPDGPAASPDLAGGELSPDPEAVEPEAADPQAPIPGTLKPVATRGPTVEPLDVLAASRRASARWHDGSDGLGSIASSLPSKIIAKEIRTPTKAEARAASW